MSETVAASGSAPRSSLASNVVANFTGAIGSLASGLGVANHALGVSVVGGQRAAFAVYAVARRRRRLALPRPSPRPSITSAAVRSAGAPPPRLAKSRGIVVRLALIFCLDSAGGGFVVQALLALWPLPSLRALGRDRLARSSSARAFLAGLSQLAFAAPRREDRSRPDDGLHPRCPRTCS